MLITIFKYLFVINAIIFGSMIVYGKCFVFRKKKPQFVSDYCATLAVFLGIYSILSIVMAWVFPSATTKLVMLGFGVSPFLIGALATYHTEKYFTAIQVLLIAISAGYVLL